MLIYLYSGAYSYSGTYGDSICKMKMPGDHTGSLYECFQFFVIMVDGKTRFPLGPLNVPFSYIDCGIFF